MSRRDWVDDSDERLSAFDNETDRLEYDDDEQICATCQRKKMDHYNGPLGKNRCIDENYIFYGTFHFRYK